MRLFIAIGLDDPVKDLLCRAQRQLKRQALGGRFSRRENLHLTLAFLGEAPDIRRAAIALDQIQAAPFLWLSRGWAISHLPKGRPGGWARPPAPLWRPCTASCAASCGPKAFRWKTGLSALT